MDIVTNVTQEDEAKYKVVSKGLDDVFVELINKYVFVRNEEGKVEFKPNETALLITHLLGVGTFLLSFYSEESKNEITQAIKEYVSKALTSFPQGIKDGK